MKDWIKNMICSREWIGEVSKMDRVWSRMTSIKPAYNLFALLIVCLFGVNENAWALRYGKAIAYSSPTAGGWVYVTKTDNNPPSSWDKTEDESSDNNAKVKDWTFPFYYYANAQTNYTFLGWASSSATNTTVSTTRTNWYVGVTATSANNVNWNYATVEYWALFGRLTTDSTTLHFSKYVDEGWGDENAFSVTYVHAGTMTATITGTNASDFSFSNSSSSQEKTVVSNNTDTESSSSVTVYFNPSASGTRTATLTLTGNGMTTSVTLSGVGNKQDQTISWDNEALIQTSMLKGKTQFISATASSGLAVTYSSDDSDILSVNASTGRLTANDLGDATITVSQAGNYKYNAATPITKDFTVKDKDTPFFTPDGFDNESTCDLHVGDRVTLTVRNVTAGLDSYFTASATQDDDKDILEITRDGNTITIEAVNAGSSTATFTQYGDDDIFDSTITYSFAVTKIPNTLVVSETSFSQNVGDSVENVISGKNNTVTAVTTTSSDSTVAYYDVAKNKIYFPNSEAKAAPLDKVTLHIIQEASDMYTGVDHTIKLTVNKCPNTLKCAWDGGSAGDDWDETVGFDDSIKVKFTNTALDAPAIEVNPVVGTTQYATRKEGTSTNPDTLVAHHNIGNAVWAVVQPENYKYARTAANCTLRVQLQESPACNIYYRHFASDTTFSKVDEMISWSEAGATDSLYFQMKKNGGGGQGKVYRSYTTEWTRDTVVYEGDKKWVEIKMALGLNETKVKFAKAGTIGTDDPYIQDIRVSRKKWFKIQNGSKADIDELTIPTNVIGGVERRATFYVDYSTCDSEIKLVSSHPRIKFAANGSTVYSFSTGGVHGRRAIELVYTSNATEEEDLDETITIYTRYEHETLDVEAHTEKHTQTGSWKENISTLSVNDTIVNAFRSILSGEKGVSYTRLSGEGLNDAIKIAHDSLIADGTGTSRIRAYVAGNDFYKEIADTIDIRVTDKKVQYIEWGDGMEKKLRRLHVGDSRVLLEAKAMSNIDTCSTNGKRSITFTSRDTSIVNVATEGGKSYLTITTTKANAGETWIVASQAGGDDGYHDYIPVSDSLRVVVRDPSAICEEYYLYNMNDSTAFSDTNTALGETFRYKGQVKSNTNFETGILSHSPAYVTLISKTQQNQTGTIYLDQYIDGAWKNAGSVVAPPLSTWTGDTIALSRKAQKVRVRMETSQKYLYCGGVKVVMAPYTEVVEGGAEKDTLVFSSFIGTPQVKDMKVRWYSRRDMHLSLPEDAPFTLSEDVFDRVCDLDTTDLRITFNTMVGQTDSCYNLIFSDGVENGFRDTVVLKATATAEEITFDGESWSNTPSEYKVANVAENAVLTISTEVAMYSLSIATGATVTVTAEGGLSVGAGGITNASSNKIKLESNTDGMTGYIRVSPDYKGVMPEADVELFTQAYYNRTETDSEKRMAKMQYIGVPVDKENYAATSLFSSKTYVYSWSESAGNWVNNKRSLKVAPFAGYSITQYDVENGGEEIEFSGKLVAPRDTTIELAYSGSDYSGRNFLANSYAAPIDISRFSYSDFSLEDEEDTSVDYAIYLFNTGAKGEYKDGVENPASLTAAGQYITVSPGTVIRLKGLDPNYPIVIPAMQGFFVKTNAAGKSLTLNYSRLVWNADYEKHGNEKMRVQRRAAEEGQEETDEELGGAMKISLYSSRAVDHIYLLESEDYSKSFENGYDGRKMLAGELNIYAIEGEEALAIDATDDLEGTKLGIRTGLDDADTIVFSRVQNVENLYLHDRYTGIYTLIEEGATYGFYADPDSYLDDRFEIIGFGSQGSATGVGNEKVDNNATKYIKDNTLFILKNGIKYNSLGQKVQ